MQPSEFQDSRSSLGSKERTRRLVISSMVSFKLRVLCIRFPEAFLSEFIVMQMRSSSRYKGRLGLRVSALYRSIQIWRRLSYWNPNDSPTFHRKLASTTEPYSALCSCGRRIIWKLFPKDRTGLAKRFRISVPAVKGRESFGSYSPFLEPSGYPTESHSNISDNKRKVPIGGFLADASGGNFVSRRLFCR